MGQTASENPPRGRASRQIYHVTILIEQQSLTRVGTKQPGAAVTESDASTANAGKTSRRLHRSAYAFILQIDGILLRRFCHST
jgi:hypothetical protein